MKSKFNRVLVTGSAGFLGFNVARYFRTAGKEVVGLWHRKESERGVVSRGMQADLVAADMDTLLGEAEAAVRHGAPLYAPDVPRLIDLLITNAAAPGIYHAAGPHRLSRHDIGLQIAQAFNLSPARIIPTEVERPAGHDPIDDCTLRPAKANALGMHFTGFVEGLSLLQG